MGFSYRFFPCSIQSGFIKVIVRDPVTCYVLYEIAQILIGFVIIIYDVTGSVRNRYKLRKKSIDNHTIVQSFVHFPFGQVYISPYLKFSLNKCVCKEYQES